MKKLVCIFVCLLFVIQYVYAQELTVKSMMAAPMDLSASQYERKDLAGKSCGLVKVQLASAGARFEGNVLGQVEYKTGEYWVFMTEGSYMLTVKHPSFVPLNVNFRDYGISGVQGKATYRLTLLMPQAGSMVQKQKLIINYTPVTAMVIVDSKVRRGNGHLELELPVGEHSYVIAEDGYDSAEGTVKLNATSPRTITESLVRAAVSQAAADAPLQVQQPIVPPVADAPKPEPVVSSSSGSAIETITVNGVSFNMVRVDGGTFQMGATSEQKNPLNWEKPVHRVTLSGYYIGETEVTQGLWEAVMGSNPSYYKGWDFPVEQVGWDDCQTFIQKLNQLTGRKFRLPTEAEWEYAARSGNKSRGYQYSGSNNLADVAWYDGNSSSATHAVKTKKSNEIGVYDMSGNVWEWCQDRYADYSSSAQTNPMGPSSGYDRVLRGGGWDFDAGFCRVSARFSSPPDLRYSYLGLRLAL